MSTEPAPLPPHRREATLRALVAGSGIGLVLAAGNVYTGLKTGFIDGGAITAALFAFIFFSVTRRAGKRAFGVLENNITQTTAASAAVMGMVLGLSGPIPALGLLGRATPPGWALALWGLGASALGIGAAVVLRRKLIVDEGLAFPTGRATGEVIQTIHTTRLAAMRRAKLLAGTALAAFAITWFRDGTPKLIPQTTAFGGTIAGAAVATLTLGMNWSPLLASTGAMIGPRAGISVLLGGAISWAVLAPWLLKAGIVREAAFGALSSWLVWPALGLLTAGSFVPLLLDFGMLRRTFRDLVALVRTRSGAGRRLAAADGTLGVFVPLFLGGVVILLLVGRSAFGIGSGALIATIVIALLLTNVSARATGETDVAPVGAVGNLTQIAFAGAGVATSLLTGAVSNASSAQTAVMLYAFRAGEHVGASPRRQIVGQLLGAVLGAAVVVPVYLIVVKAYGVGTEALPAASAQSWKAMAEAIQGGAAAFPPRALLAGGLGLATGIGIALAARTRVGRFLPSPAAMGMAMLIPGSYALAIFAGAMAVVAARRVRADLSEEAVLTAASGGMAGESLAGVIVACLSALGIL